MADLIASQCFEVVWTLKLGMYCKVVTLVFQAFVVLLEEHFLKVMDQLKESVLFLFTQKCLLSTHAVYSSGLVYMLTPGNNQSRSAGH